MKEGNEHRGKPSALAVELLVPADPRWRSVEGALDQTHRSLTLQSRHAWVQLLSDGRGLLAVVRDASEEPIFAISVLSSLSSALPGHEIWRIHRLGLDVPLEAVARAIEVIVAEARKRKRVLRVDVSIVTPDSQRRVEIAQTLSNAGFRRRREPEQVYPRTIILDLTLRPSELLVALSKNTRRDIRLPLRVVG